MAKIKDEDGISLLEKEGFTKNHNIPDKLKKREIKDIEELVELSWQNKKDGKDGAIDFWENLRNDLLKNKGVKVTETNNYYRIRILERRAPDEEKARINSTMNIRNGLRAILADMIPLYKHLKDRIKTDGTCRYEIDSSEQRWHIKWNK